MEVDTFETAPVARLKRWARRSLSEHRIDVRIHPSAVPDAVELLLSKRAGNGETIRATVVVSLAVLTRGIYRPMLTHTRELAASIREEAARPRPSRKPWGLTRAARP
jgi:hypothetical protein